MNWKTISSEYLFNDLWFKVRKEKCETPSGKIVDPYYVYDFPTWVTALALTEDGKVILEKQYRHALGDGDRHRAQERRDQGEVLENRRAAERGGWKGLCRPDPQRARPLVRGDPPGQHPSRLERVGDATHDWRLTECPKPP